MALVRGILIPGEIVAVLAGVLVATLAPRPRARLGRRVAMRAGALAVVGYLVCLVALALGLVVVFAAAFAAAGAGVIVLLRAARPPAARGDEPDEGPGGGGGPGRGPSDPPDGAIDWAAFERDLARYAAERDRTPAGRGA